MGVWTGVFTSLKGVTYTVRIAKDGISDKTLALAPEPVSVKMSGSGRFDGMRSVELEIGVLTKDAMSELFGEDIFETAVAMTHTEAVPGQTGVTRTVVDFVGFLEVSDWNMPCTPGRVEEKQLVAIDGLSAYGQKPYYERKAIKMVDHVDAMLSDMNGKLSAAGLTGVTVTRQLTNNWSGWVSSEVLQPEDPYETKSSEGNWPSWADYVEEYAKGIFETVYMVGAVVKSQIQANAQTWIGADAAAETRLASNKMTMMMEPSRMKLKLEYDEARNLHDPEWVRPVYWGVNWSQVNHTAQIDGRVAKLWYPQTGYTKHWVKGGDWPAVGTKVLACASAVIGVTYGDTESQASSDAPTPMIGISAVTDYDLVMIPSATSAGTNTTVSLNAKVFINPAHVDNVPEYCCPLVWVRSAQEKTSGSECTFALTVGGTTYTAGQVTVGSANGDDNWLDVTYVFTVPVSVLQANGYKVKVVLRSPGIVAHERGYHFAKDVQLVGYGYDEDDGDKTTVVTVNGKDTGSVLDAKMKMGFFTRLGTINGTQESSTTIISRLKAGYVSQYAVARKKWKMDVTDDGWSPEKKVWCRGAECTQLTASWNPRYGKVTMTVIENG